MSLASPRPALAAGALVCTMLLSACGGNPTVAGAVDRSDPDVLATYERYSELQAGTERQDRLVRECRDEGALNINSASSVVQDLIPIFEDKYGVDVSLVEPTSSESQRQRVLMEQKADRISDDLLITYASDLANIYSVEGVTADYSSDITAELDEEVRSEQYISLYQYPVVPQYNTNLVSEDDAPRSYSDLADPKWKGKLGLVKGDGNWYFTLFEELTGEGGMSVTEFERTFKGIADNSRSFEGHGSASLVAAGEIPMLVNGYQFFTENLQAENAPVSSEPAIEPIAMMRFGAGMTTTAEHPACAVLFSEWSITDGQDVVVDHNYYPANLKAVKGDLPFSVEDHHLAHIPLDSVNAEQFSEWQDAFENLVSGKDDILPEYVR